MRGFITRRFPWLKSDHPLVVRDSRRINRELPKFLRKLTDPWTMLGYAALVHGAFFALSLVGFQRLIFGMSDLFLPFLTPFGTPLVAAFLHSVLYWALMIGLANYSTYLIASDVSTGTWEILRLTPYSSSTILGAKLVASARVWGRVFRALLITRLIAVLILPAAIVFQQQANEGRSFATLDFVAAFIFIAQPLVDGLLVLGLSTVAAFAIRSTTWARIGAYGLVAVVYGALSGIGSFWLIFRSPMGALAGVLTPLAHWAPLAAGVLKPQSPQEFVLRTTMMILIYLVLPLAIAGLCLSFGRRFARGIR